MDPMETTANLFFLCSGIILSLVVVVVVCVVVLVVSGSLAHAVLVGCCFHS